MGISRAGAFDDVLDSSYVSIALSVGTSAVEAKVSANRLTGRQQILLHNDSESKSVFIGPSTVTSSGSNKGIELRPGEFLQIPLGESVGLFLIAGSGTASIIVQELA
jgi:hypothetical protein